MGKRSKNGRRNFVRLAAHDQADTAAILATSSAAHAAASRRARDARAVVEAEDVVGALRASAESAEVMVRGLPPDTGGLGVAVQIAKWLDEKGIGVGVAMGKRVMKVAIQKNSENSCNAVVLLWTKLAADTLVEVSRGTSSPGSIGLGSGLGGRATEAGTSLRLPSGGGHVYFSAMELTCFVQSVLDSGLGRNGAGREPGIQMLGRTVWVHPSGRSVPGVGQAWGSRMEPGSKRFPIGLLEVGEMKRVENIFHIFWQSEKIFDLRKTAHVELNRGTLRTYTSCFQ